MSDEKRVEMSCARTPHALHVEAATLCSGGCNPTCLRLPPYGLEAWRSPARRSRNRRPSTRPVQWPPRRAPGYVDGAASTLERVGSL